MQCGYFEAGLCHSCTLLPTPYERQLADKDAKVRCALTEFGTPDLQWLAPAASHQRDFRSKVKLVAGGTPSDMRLGILGPDLNVQDLRDCPIVVPEIRDQLPQLARLIERIHIEPYSVKRRRGELKYVIVTAGDDRQLMVRFVLRSRRHMSTLRTHLDAIRQAVPIIRVVTANIHPTHAALVEGPDEYVLTDEITLPMTVGRARLQVGPRSFTQTNTRVASALYMQVASWLTDVDARSVWDLYCGVGGFALNAAAAGVQDVTGVEISGDAVEAAKNAAQHLEVTGRRVRTRFIAADATKWAREQSERAVPDAIVVNPPRRGLGNELATWLNGCGAHHIVYSSCNPATLVEDLASMPSYQVSQGRIFDMFAHTRHVETICLMSRVGV